MHDYPTLTLRETMASDLSPTELNARLQAGEDLHLVDVREPEEFAFCRLPGSVLVPLGELAARAGEIRAAGPVVLVCHHGVRSGQAQRYLEQRLGRQNVLNLRGGIHQWSLTVDPGVPIY